MTERCEIGIESGSVAKVRDITGGRGVSDLRSRLPTKSTKIYLKTITRTGRGSKKWLGDITDFSNGPLVLRFIFALMLTLLIAAQSLKITVKAS